MPEEAKKPSPKAKSGPPMEKKPKIHPGRKINLTPMQQFQKAPFSQTAVEELKRAIEIRRGRNRGVTREKRAWELRANTGANFFLRPSRFQGADAPPHADSHLPKLLADPNEDEEFSEEELSGSDKEEHSERPSKDPSIRPSKDQPSKDGLSPPASPRTPEQASKLRRPTSKEPPSLRPSKEALSPEKTSPPPRASESEPPKGEPEAPAPDEDPKSESEES